MENKSGTLYIVGTPIGNLEDITLRQLRIFKEVDYITAEDTRVTKKLLNYYDIKKELISYHEHSDKSVIDRIISLLKSGNNIATVTDAGMPCISDPGAPLIERAYEEGIKVEVIPGPSALISALAVSCQDTRQFTFEGFLPVANKERKERLSKLKNESRTMVFYEAPHKLVRTLEDFLEIFGSDRSISICHELTKIHESVKIYNMQEACNYYKENMPKGEYVLVVEGKKASDKPEISIEEAVRQVKNLAESGEKLRTACKKIGEITGYTKNELYSAYQEKLK